MRFSGTAWLAAFFLAAPSAQSAQDYTGYWRVEITVVEGECPPSQLMISIERETVRLIGLMPGSASTATIAKGGMVNWTLPVSSDQLRIQGKLLDRTGSGKWMLVTAK